MRRLRGGWGERLIDAADRDEFVSLAGRPRVLKHLTDAEEIEVSSYLKEPSEEGLAEVREWIGQELPADFLDFMAKYGESVIVTRTRPIHIFSWREIAQQISGNTVTGRDRKPRRFFRFGGPLRSDVHFYGLRQVDEGSRWEVIPAAIEPDEFLEGATDFGEYEYYAPEPLPEAVAPSFHEWIRHLIETDGMKDHYLHYGYHPVPFQFEPC